MGLTRWSQYNQLLLLLIVAFLIMGYMTILDVPPIKTYVFNAPHSTYKTLQFLNHQTILLTTENKSDGTSLTPNYVNTTTEDHITDNNDDISTPCPNIPAGLSPVPADKSRVNEEDVEKKYPDLQPGGQYTPELCTARHRVAIIVPFRDRHEHLMIFLNHMHSFLRKQMIDYGIFVLEQHDTMPFNRGKLLNIGFVESQKLKDWDCFIIHDVDLLPLDLRNMYSCPKQPRHMSAAIDVFDFKLPYINIFGGVCALTKEQFQAVNGFSNNYWGWGGEDDDMFIRLTKRKFIVSRYKLSIARYTMLDHEKSKPNPERFKLLSKSRRTTSYDGLSTLNYEVIETKMHRLYTHILVNLD